VLKALMAQVVHQELLEFKDLKELQDFREHKAHRAPLVFKEFLV
jgi:hypothetical protein